MARFSKAKNIPLLIQSYAEVDSNIREKLLLVGGFPDQDVKGRVDALINQYRLDSEVHITGFVKNQNIIIEYLLSMRVFIVCSFQEGLPTALLEAASTGVPIVATAVGGMKDILKNGENALLVSPGDKDGLASSIEMLLKDEHLARKLSKGSLKLSEKHNPDQESKTWIQLYKNLLMAN